MYDVERNNREIEEALAAGRAALDSLNRVNQSLSSAKKFWDLGYAWRRFYQWYA